MYLIWRRKLTPEKEEIGGVSKLVLDRSWFSMPYDYNQCVSSQNKERRGRMYYRENSLLFFYEVAHLFPSSFITHLLFSHCMKNLWSDVPSIWLSFLVLWIDVHKWGSLSSLACHTLPCVNMCSTHWVKTMKYISLYFINIVFLLLHFDRKSWYMTVSWKGFF